MPKSDFFMLMVRTGETEHELPAELAQRIETLTAAHNARVWDERLSVNCVDSAVESFAR